MSVTAFMPERSLSGRAAGSRGHRHAHHGYRHEAVVLAFLRRLGSKVTIPVAEVDETGGFVLAFRVENGTFHFELQAKQ
jgi:hypothetical protein